MRDVGLPKEAEDVGCWAVDKLESLKDMEEISSPIPSLACLAHCFSHGYLLAAVQRLFFCLFFYYYYIIAPRHLIAQNQTFFFIPFFKSYINSHLNARSRRGSGLARELK
jgi:hypothetical protein